MVLRIAVSMLLPMHVRIARLKIAKRPRVYTTPGNGWY